MVLSPLLHSSNFILRFIWSHSIGHCCTLNCARCFSPVSIRGEDLSSSSPLQSHTYTHSHLDTARCKNNLPLFTSEQESGAGCQVQGNKEKWLLEAWRVLFSHLVPEIWTPQQLFLYRAACSRKIFEFFIEWGESAVKWFGPGQTNKRYYNSQAKFEPVVFERSRFFHSQI